MSLGIVQQTPTQFDDPFYRYLVQESSLQFVVYYYGSSGSDAKEDFEIGRQVGWGSSPDRGYPARFWLGLGSLQFAARVIKAKHELIIISGYSHAHALCTAILGKMRGIPVGLRSDNVLPARPAKDLRWLLKSLAYPSLFGLYTTAHPVGEQAGEYLMRFGFNEASLFRFPYGVNHQWFARESLNKREAPDELRASWGLPANAKVVCGVMKFSDREDPVTLVKAFLSARQQLPALALLLVGDGPLKRDVEEAAGEQLGKSIILTGYLSYSMLPSVYASSDLFVHTARGAWEVSVNEALACGIPVVASDAVGSVYELVIPNLLGRSFRHGDIDDLARCILCVVNDPELRERASREGIESLRTWDYPATAKRLQAAVEFARSA
jgi:glycosyltransferase involved in cell wall biosynthesis